MSLDQQLDRVASSHKICRKSSQVSTRSTLPVSKRTAKADVHADDDPYQVRKSSTIQWGSCRHCVSSETSSKCVWTGTGSTATMPTATAPAEECDRKVVEAGTPVRRVFPIRRGPPSQEGRSSFHKPLRSEVVRSARVLADTPEDKRLLAESQVQQDGDGDAQPCTDAQRDNTAVDELPAAVVEPRRLEVCSPRDVVEKDADSKDIADVSPRKLQDLGKHGLVEAAGLEVDANLDISEMQDMLLRYVRLEAKSQNVSLATATGSAATAMGTTAESPCDELTTKPQPCASAIGDDDAEGEDREDEQCAVGKVERAACFAALRGRAAALAKRRAELLAKVDAAAIVRDSGGDDSSSSGPSERRSNNGVERRAPARPWALLQVQEERSTEFDFGITFLLPKGKVGADFIGTVLAAFPTTRPNSASSLYTLVPYGGDKTALVALQQLGPVEALEQARRSTSFAGHELSSLSTDKCRIVQRKGLPDTADEIAALTAALVYVVHTFRSVEDTEQQLGPVCAVEAFYRAAAGKYKPQRYIAAVQEPSSSGTVVDLNRPGPFGEEVLKKLQSRAVNRLPCAPVESRDLAGHRSLIVQIVEALAMPFRSGFSEEKSQCSLGSETTTAVGSPQSSPQTTPHSTPLSSPLNSVSEASGTCAYS